MTKANKINRFDFDKKLFLHPSHISRIKGGQRPFPITIEIDLTDVCNHKCSFCFTPKQDKKDQKSLNMETVIQLLDDIYRLGTRGISFTGGGESMLHPDFEKIVLHAKKRGFDLGLMTNGSMLNAKNRQLVNNNFQWVRISMSGGTAEIYNKVQGVNHFNMVVNNIKELLSLKRDGLTVGVRMLVNNKNIDTVSSLINEFWGTNLSYIQFATNQFAKKDITHGRKFKKILKETETFIPIQTQGYENIQDKAYPSKCYAHFFQIAINARGDVLFCKNCRNSNKFRIGNIYENNIIYIWHNDIVKQLESTITPANCGLFCKNSKLNKTMEDILNPSDLIQPNFVN